MSPYDLEVNFNTYLGLFTRLNIFTNEITFNNFVLEGIDHDRLEQYLHKMKEGLGKSNISKSTLIEAVIGLINASLVAYSDFKVL